MKKPLFAVVLGLTIASGASVALAAVPGVTSEGNLPPKVKPASIIYTGDGSGFFAGPKKVSKRNFGKLHWTTWGNSKAVGSGANWLNNCTPSCAQGKFSGYPVTLKLTKPKVIGGHDVFTRMRVTYTGKLPSQTAKSQTWKLSHTGMSFFWSPPLGVSY